MAMNRIFHIVLLSLSVAACTVYSGTDCCRSASNLESFSVRLVGLSSACAVDMLCDRSEPSDAINDPDFRIYDYLEYAQGSRIDYYIVRSSDGVWDVTISGDVMNASFQILREDSAGGPGYAWRVLPFTLEYDEGDGYAAVLATEDDVVFDWVYDSYENLTPSWILRQTGIYFLSTFVRGEAGDSAQLQYSSGNVHFTGGPDY